MVLVEILEQHVDEAAMLSSRRMRSVPGTVKSFATLTQLDRRIDAHLDGLNVDTENAWTLCETTVKFEGKNVCRLGDPLFQNKKNIMG